MLGFREASWIGHITQNQCIEYKNSGGGGAVSQFSIIKPVNFAKMTAGSPSLLKKKKKLVILKL